MISLIYCAAGNPRFAQIAIEQGFTYGAQLPNKVYYSPQFVDQDWRNPDRAKYMASLAEHRPALATVLDLERAEQFEEVMSWAEEAAQWVGEAVIIIPKAMGIVPKIPETIRDKDVRLGYSVPTRYAGTELPVWEFSRRSVHLLGGSPQAQRELALYLNVASADGNYAQKMAVRFGQFYACNGQSVRAKQRYWPRMSEIHPVDDDLPYHAFRLSCINIRAEWNGCRAYIRYATDKDIAAIKHIANQHKDKLGFVNRAALLKATLCHELYVAEYLGAVVGFVNWHRRRDGRSTIYEVAVDKRHQGGGMGRALVQSVPTPVQLKCTVDNPANRFYERIGFQVVKRELGKRKELNVWRSERV